MDRRIFLEERGEIHSSLRQGQEEELGALGLLLNIVVHWDATYMQEVITQLIALFTAAKSNTDSDIAGFATKTLPTLQMHKQW